MNYVQNKYNIITHDEEIKVFYHKRICLKKKIIKHVNIQLMILDPLIQDMSPKDF